VTNSSDSSAPAGKPRRHVAGRIFTIALLGFFIFAIKLALVMQQISATDRIIDNYPSIQDVPTSVMAKAFHLPGERNKATAALAALTIVLIASGWRMSGSGVSAPRRP
jgi:hypothetical protein